MIRKTVIGEETVGAFILLVAASWAIPNFVPAYYPVLLATAVRNVFLPGIGVGVAYYVIVAIGFYVEAVIVASAYRLVSTLYRRTRPKAAMH